LYGPNSREFNDPSLGGLVSLLSDSKTAAIDRGVTVGQAREIDAVFTTLANALPAASTRREMNRAAAEYNRGHALSRYLAEDVSRRAALTVDLNERLGRSADREDASGVIALDLSGPDPASIDYAAAADLVSRQIAAARGPSEGRWEGAVNLVLFVDVAQGRPHDVLNAFENALRSRVSDGRITEAELRAVRSAWLVAHGDLLATEGVRVRGVVDADRLHGWIAARRRIQWNLGGNYVLSVLTQDESRWKASRKDFIRILQILLPSVAVHITEDLQNYLRAKQVLDIQA
jgi:hypothetical protein